MTKRENGHPGKRLAALCLLLSLLLAACGDGAVESETEPKEAESAVSTETAGGEEPESEPESESETEWRLEPEPGALLKEREDGIYQPISVIYQSSLIDWGEYGSYQFCSRYKVEGDTLYTASKGYDIEEAEGEIDSFWTEIGELQPVDYTKKAFSALFDTLAGRDPNKFPTGMNPGELYDDCLKMEAIMRDAENGGSSFFFLGTEHNGLVLLEYSHDANEETRDICTLGFILGKDNGDSLTAEEGLEEGSIGGTCMNDVRWVLDQDGLLTISGKGYAHTPIYHERCMEFGTIAEKYPIRRVVVEDGVTVLAAGLFQYLSSLESVEIAPSVVSWGNGLFSGCTALKEVRGGGKLRTIPALCFSGCGELNTFEIADSVRSIGLEAFHACSSLVFPALPEKIIEIENDAFSSCGGFPYLTITKDMEIGEYAFADMTVLEEVVIEEGVTAIGPGWFSNCTSLHSVTLPGSLRIIDWYAFEGTKNLRKIVLPPSLTTIGDGAFSRSALEEIEVPASVRVISTEAFGFCLDLKKVTLHEGLERIGPTAFDTDGQIESLKVPASVKQVGSYLFAESTGIHEVIFLGDPKEITFGTEEYLMGPFTESQLQTITFLDKDGNQLDPASFLGE